MAHMNLMKLYQEKFLDIQDFRIQYMAIKKVCDELGLHLARFEDQATVLMAEKCVIYPILERSMKAMVEV